MHDACRTCRTRVPIGHIALSDDRRLGKLFFTLLPRKMLCHVSARGRHGAVTKLPAARAAPTADRE